MYLLFHRGFNLNSMINECGYKIYIIRTYYVDLSEACPELFFIMGRFNF